MDILKNKKGSIMVLLVLVIAVTTLLGTTVLCLTGINYKMRRTNSEYMENSYMSESGIDEAYALAMKIYNDIYMESENYETNLVNDINLDIKNIICGDMNKSDSENRDYISIDDEIIKEKVDHEFRIYFEKRFIEEFRNRFNGFVSIIDQEIKISGTIGSFNYHRASIMLKSKYMDNSIERFNTAELTVKSPEVVSSYINGTFSDENMVFNPILSKPAFVQGNVYFKGDCTVNGDVIVLGSMIDTEFNSSIQFSCNDLSVYGNEINSTKLTGSIKLNSNSSLDGINTLYTNSIYSSNSLHSISGITVDGIVANDIIMDSNDSSVIEKSLGLGVSNLSEGFIDDMKLLLKNIGENPGNTINNDIIDYDETQPVQLLYDIVSGGNKDPHTTHFDSSKDETYYICATNQNSKTIHIFGPPYYMGSNQNDNTDKDIYGECLNITARNIDSQHEIIFEESEEAEAFDLKGIIVSAGDVHLYGNINFEGAIICFGDLYIEGEGVKSLTNNYSTNLAWELGNSGHSFNDAFTDFNRFLSIDIPVENLDMINNTSGAKPFTKKNWRMTYGD